MTLEQRRPEIEEITQAEETEGEVEGGHKEICSGSETPPVEEIDDLTPQEIGEVGDAGDAEVYVEAPSGVTATPQEVEGFDKEVIAGYQKKAV